jgi:hypothetical protein
MTEYSLAIKSNEVAGCQWLTFVILATWEIEICQPGQIVHETPIFKLTRTKWTGDVVQVVQCLLYKHKDPSLTPDSNNNKKTNVELTHATVC